MSFFIACSLLAEASFHYPITHSEKEIEATLAAADRVFAKMAK